MNKFEEHQVHGAGTKQSTHSKITNSHHSEGHHGSGYQPHTHSVTQAHHSTGHEGFMSEGEDCPE